MFVACSIHNILVPDLKKAIKDENFKGNLFRFERTDSNTIEFVIEFFRLPCIFRYNTITGKSVIVLKQDEKTQKVIYADVPESSARIMI